MLTLLWMGVAHVVGDYLFQTDALARRKGERGGALALHAGLYALAMGLVFLVAPFGRALPAWAVLSGSHWLIDGLRVRADRRWADARAGLISFCADQALHLGLILLCWLLWLRGARTALFARLCGLVWFPPVLAWTALLCVIWDPAAILVRKVLALFPSAPAPEAPDFRSGELIGKLERLLVAALVLGGYGGTIGFVLTAKSVARFKRFEEQGFAERYLVGTLLSASIALIAALLLKRG